MKEIREKRHRLDEQCYVGRVVVAFTLCIKDRISIFTSESLCHHFRQLLFEEARQQGCDVIAYVFIPDHCHIILEGKKDNSQTLDVIKRFKQKSGFWFYQNRMDVRWQKDFYDHIIREDETLEKHINYLLENPIRRGISTDWHDYRFKGSMVYNFDEW
jgi:putative transposase